jgi:hypothetical protein
MILARGDSVFGLPHDPHLSPAIEKTLARVEENSPRDAPTSGAVAERLKAAVC